MIIFSISFFYNNQGYSASVFETDSLPKHWTITVSDERLPIEFQKNHLIMCNNETDTLEFGCLPSDNNNAFMNSLVQGLSEHLSK